MFYPFRLYLKDKVVLFSLIISGLIVLYIVWMAAFYIRPTSDQLFLHYNIIFGIDLIGEWWQLYLLPLGSLLVLLINFALSYFFYRLNRFLSRFLSVVTVIFEALILISSVLIIGLNL